MFASNAVIDAAAPRGRRSRRRNGRDRRHGRSNVSAGTEKTASSDDDWKSGVVARNFVSQSNQIESNCESDFGFPLSQA